MSPRPANINLSNINFANRRLQCFDSSFKNNISIPKSVQAITFFFCFSCYGVLRFLSITVYYGFPLLRCITVFFYYGVLRFSSATVYYGIPLLRMITVFLYYGLLRFTSTAVYYGFPLLRLITVPQSR